jgi:hypothetical protein
VQRGDFGYLHTLRDFYRRIDRHRDSRRRSWSRGPAVPDLVEVRQFRDDFGNGLSDSELVIDLSLHKKGAALKSSDDFRLNLSDRLCPPESDVYWKSKSCGSSPLPGLNQFVVVCPGGSGRYPSDESNSRSDVVTGSSYPSISIRSSSPVSSPVCCRPMSPPALCPVQDEVNVRATGFCGVSPSLPVMELSTDRRKSVHLPDCQLPLKKRKIHEETVSDDGKSPIPDYAEMLSRQRMRLCQLYMSLFNTTKMVICLCT